MKRLAFGAAAGLAIGYLLSGGGGRKPPMVGAWHPGAPWDLSKLDEIEDMIGRRLDIVHWYQGWGAANRDFSAEVVNAVLARGSLPLITWEPWDYTAGMEQPRYRPTNIAAGAFDSYITSWADAVGQISGSVFIRLAHEMNHPLRPWSVGAQGNMAADYVAMWRHVVDIFRRQETRNAIWVWSPIIEYAGTTPFRDVYPGGDYVDWVGLDGYNGGNEVSWGGWVEFESLFRASYQKLSSMADKPVMIGETASAEGGGNKAHWIREAFGLKGFPGIGAIIWFNESGEADWRINSSPASLAAFITAVNCSNRR